MSEQFEVLIIEAISFIPKLIVAVVIFIASLVLAGTARRWAYRIIGEKIDSEETQQLFARLARWGVIIAGTLIALDQINFDVTGFLTGLGIAGFTIGFALQDIARNFIAGLLLLVQRPFNIEDLVEIAGFTGRVLSINARDTEIKTFDGEIVILPNTSVLSNPIINYSRQSNRRRKVTIGLGYEQDADHAIDIFLNAMREIDGVLATPEPQVLAQALGDSALTLVAYFWVNQRTHSLINVQSDVVMALNAAAERADITLPYPIQTVRVAYEGELQNL